MIHTVITRTGAEEVVIDGGTGFRPGGFGADLGSLVVQPGTGVGGVVQGTFGEDVVDVPLTGEGGKDPVITGGLSLAASRVGSATGTLEDLAWCELMKPNGEKGSPVPGLCIHQTNRRRC